jgi:hypothetical protein
VVGTNNNTGDLELFQGWDKSGPEKIQACMISSSPVIFLLIAIGMQVSLSPPLSSPHVCRPLVNWTRGSVSYFGCSQPQYNNSTSCLFFFAKVVVCIISSISPYSLRQVVGELIQNQTVPK